MMRRRRHKCRHCGELFHLDPRNQYHQKYCSEPACRRSSKTASQKRWLAKSHNRDYFRGPAHVARVRAWRAAFRQCGLVRGFARTAAPTAARDPSGSHSKLPHIHEPGPCDSSFGPCHPRGRTVGVFILIA
jgi:hypothetical protein